MTIAASATLGTSCSTPVSHSRKPTTSSPAAICASCVRIPAVSATAVRDWLEEEGKPRSSPAPMFPTPSATSSWLASSVSPWRSANARAVRIDCAKPTNARPPAIGTSAPMSPSDTCGTDESGQAGRHGPDDRDALGRKPEQRDGAAAEHERGERAREPGREASQDRRARRSGTTPSAIVRHCASPM